MLDSILDFIDPYLAEGIFAVLMFYLGGPIRFFLRTKSAQESLRSAIHTGTDLVTDQIARVATDLPGATAKAINVDKIVDYIKGSVPDSLKFLKASDEQITKMAEAEVTARLTAMSKR